MYLQNRLHVSWYFYLTACILCIHSSIINITSFCSASGHYLIPISPSFLLKRLIYQKRPDNFISLFFVGMKLP